VTAGFDIDALSRAVKAHGPVARVVVARVDGSAPREAGAAMLVWADGFDGTIGGGALEHQAIAEARSLLTRPGAWLREARRVPLGPTLGQCCGGSVQLLTEVFRSDEIAMLEKASGVYARPVRSGAPAGAPPLAITSAERAQRSGAASGLVLAKGDPDWISEPLAPALTPLFLYGAGHVGRAVVRVFEGLRFVITWVDDAPARFPETIPAHAARLVAANPADAVAVAPADAAHLVMTYSHPLDLEICHRVLTRGDFARLGLIGSASKSARFRKRLRALGHDDAAIARLICPIGLPGLGGKAPAEIAVAVAAEYQDWNAARAANRKEARA
jgi:xanthine dehydrogenase accessory factor